MDKPVFALDCDDLLLDFTSVFNEWHNNEFGTNLRKEEMREYHLTELLGISKEEERARVVEFQKTMQYAHLPALPGAKRFVRELQAHANIVIVTARGPQSAQDARKNLFEEIGVEFQTIIDQDIINAHGSKAAICHQMGFLGLCDDNHKNITQCMTHEPRVPAIILDQPWNRHVEIPGALRARDHKEALMLIRALLRR